MRIQWLPWLVSTGATADSVGTTAAVQSNCDRSISGLLGRPVRNMQGGLKWPRVLEKGQPLSCFGNEQVC